MISDRPYMRQSYNREPGTSVLTWLLCALGAGLIFQLILQAAGNSSLLNMFALPSQALALGRYWTVVTYPLVNEHFLIALANGLGIFLAGREVLPLLGPKRFCGLVLLAILLGAGSWLAVQPLQPTATTLLGASAITTALFVVFASVYPEKEVEFLLFFVLPLKVRPRVMIWTLLTFELLGFLFSELSPGLFQTRIAHSAHLGGMLAGWIFHRFVHARNGWDRADAAPFFQLPAWWHRLKHPAPPKYRVNITPPADLKTEVDRILDKINTSGFASLTDEEKRLLDEAKDLLSRH